MMNAILQRWHSICAALRSSVHAGNERIKAFRARFSFGIASRLAATFLCVGVLAVTADLMVEHVVLVEKTTEITRVAPSSATPVNANATAQPVIALASESLLSAIDRFGRAAQDRGRANEAQSAADYQRSRSELERASREFVAHAVSISGKAFAKLTSTINSYKEHGDDLVLAADQRHAMMINYAALFEGIYGRVNDSLKGAWKVFGRVLARQSLLQLSADLDALRRTSAAVTSADSVETPDLQPLLETEHVLTSYLQSHEKGLRRSQGDSWYIATHDDLEHLIALREAITQLNAQLHRQSQELVEESARVSGLVPSKLEAAPAIPAPKKISHVDESAINPAQNGALLGVPGAIELDRAPQVVTQSVTTHAPLYQRDRAMMAWVAVAVLLLLISIAGGTVVSIVGPVRRLRDATTRVALGDTTVRVRRGGIRELDTLGIAFNAMAEELSAAKVAANEYQQGLESKVNERTQQLQELAERDPLTGLPNRRQFFVLLNAAIVRSRRENCLIGLFFLDVDNFKYLNDSMGHAFGDRVLVSLARRLHAATSAIGFAARLGGDEFTVVFERAQCLEDIQLAGERVVEVFQKPLSVDGRDLIVSVSVGASIYPEHEQDAEALLKAADAALFRAKVLGRNRLAMFTPDLLEAAAAKFSTEQGLRRALELGEFELVYQPEVNAETLETVLVEALIRWRMPDGTLSTPDEFLAVAEDSGMIMEIGDWVLRGAIQAAAAWHHGDWPDARVAINVSPRQLLDSRFFDRLSDLLREHRLPACCIEIELTESVLQTGRATIEALRRLRAHGVAIALDDFGAGYSSLTSLEQLPLTRIKLDRGLIAGIDTNPRSAAIARAIIGMCHGLGLQVTAEGVERSKQFALLLGFRAMYLQGYLLSRPVPRDEVLRAMADVTQRSQELLLRLQISRSSNIVELSPPALKLPETG